MIEIIFALAPVFLCIAIGFVIRQMGFPGEAFWPLLNRVVYYIFYPALLVENLATADLGGPSVIFPLGLALVGAQILMAFVMSLSRRALKPTGPQYSSMFQGTVRWNGFVAIAAIAALYGPDGVTLAAIALAFMVPVANVLSVYVLAKHASAAGPVKARMVAEQLIKNPLLIACVIGILLNALSIPLPRPALDTIGVLGDAALTMGLLAVGAGLEFESARRSSGLIALTCVLKLVIMPVFAFTAMSLAGVSGLAFMVGMVCAAVPGATSSYILARQLGGDAPMMAGIITAGTLAAFVTMPVMLIVVARLV